MKLVEEFTIFTDTAIAVPIGDGPYGPRIIHEHNDGKVTGERINGRLLGTSDWSLVGADGFLRIDSRAQIETSDGAFLGIQFRGLLELNDLLRQSLETGEGTSFEDQYCFINLQIETGNERYSWVNRTFFVGQGRARKAGGVEYKIFRPA